MGNTTSVLSSKGSDITTMKSESIADDDVLIRSNDTEEAEYTNKIVPHPMLSRPQTVEFTIRPGDPQWDNFKFLATKYLYSQDAFPNQQQMKEACQKIARELNSGKNNPTDTLYHIGHGLIKRFYAIGDINRRHVHRAVKRWIRSYQWPVSAFPLTCSTSKAELYEFLAHHARFSRKDYDENGRMLQNHCLTHCLNYVMFKDKSTRGSFQHQQLVKPLPKPLVVYVMVMIHYNLERLARKYKRLRTKNYRGSVWSVYYPPTCWHREEYKALLNSSSKYGRQLQWDRIIQTVSQKLDALEEAENDEIDGADNALDDLLGATM